MYEANLFLIIGILENNPTLEVLNISNNELLSFEECVDDEDLLFKFNLRRSKNQHPYRIPKETRQAIGALLSENKVLRRLIDGDEEDMTEGYQNTRDSRLLITLHSV
mmetsp:Transcript_32894/g.32236  ORF Transcript_32894/g.32236 Transcript_32894/m.32236 type:complete len:107 (-) Transcript_32894:20-340(-)|eukprot:CAMPEP_0197009690 /NCGR_PEP_ID=MMETSP1380-20130617/51114_1 /TAXON_ID=5936 /ORGANISM="Euplotes crassus, Strain CT5" /LENGTH=106 /DNA_ID=CAMNT_0042431099 /DNA_START=1747 /DNA_END=2067 /DNA_ORIENTATION=-